MTPPTVQDLLAAVEATWPAARVVEAAPWRLRDGAGGGKRVSAATAEGPVGPADLAAMEAGLAAFGQTPLVMVRVGEDALDATLRAAGYGVVDPVVIYLAPTAALSGPLPPVSAFPHWPPLAIARDLWEEGGIGPARVAVMERAAGPKCAILARNSDAASGVGYAAIHRGVAMLHALEISPRFRRQGAASNILRATANWAQDHDAAWFSLVVTERNDAARALYASLGMQVVGHYHYRAK